MIENAYEVKVQRLNNELADFSERNPHKDLPQRLADFKKWRISQETNNPVINLPELLRLLKAKSECYNPAAKAEIACYGIMMTAATLIAFPGRYYMEYKLLLALKNSERVQAILATSKEGALMMKQYMSQAVSQMLEKILGRSLTSAEITALEGADLSEASSLKVFSAAEQDKIKAQLLAAPK